MKYIGFSDISLVAQQCYDLFTSKEGSQYIAKPISVQALLEIIERTKPQRILEIGGGIGLLSYVCLEFSSAILDIFENNDFCLAALNDNLREFKDGYHLIQDYENFLLPSLNYDLLIIDGGTPALVKAILNQLVGLKLIYIEGKRGEQKKIVRAILKEKYLFKIINYFDKNKKFKGGQLIACYKSQSKIAKTLNFLYYEGYYLLRNYYGVAVKRLRSLLG